MSNSFFANKTQKNLINEVAGGIITYVKSKYNIQNKKEKICSHKKAGDLMLKVNELKAEMARSGLTTKKLAEELGIHPATLSNKINGKTEFACDEMMKIGEILHLSQKHMADIFFGH